MTTGEYSLPFASMTYQNTYRLLVRHKRLLEDDQLVLLKDLRAEHLAQYRAVRAV